MLVLNLPFKALMFLTLMRPSLVFFLFFFNDTATTEIYTLSLHDALRSPSNRLQLPRRRQPGECGTRANAAPPSAAHIQADRKSTRLNSSHLVISYAVFCLKKKSFLNTMPHRSKYD